LRTYARTFADNYRTPSAAWEGASSRSRGPRPGPQRGVCPPSGIIGKRRLEGAGDAWGIGPGEIVRFERFEDFVTTPPLEGLGSDVRQLKHLCQDDTAALDAIDQATTGRQGERTDLHDNIREVKDETSYGTSNTYALRKLRKDRPDLHERVLADEMTPHAAMVEAGPHRAGPIGPGPRGTHPLQWVLCAGEWGAVLWEPGSIGPGRTDHAGAG